MSLSAFTKWGFMYCRSHGAFLLLHPLGWSGRTLAFSRTAVFARHARAQRTCTCFSIASMDHLQQRTKFLELQVGTDESSIVEEISQIQAKLQQLYEIHPELYTLNQLQREIPASKEKNATCGSNDSVEEGVKQELIAVKYARFSETLQNVAELQTIQFAEILGDMCQALDVSRVAAKREELMRVAQNYHKILIKALVTIQQFENMVVRENRFWLTYQKRLDAANARICAAERKQNARNKY